MQAVARKLPCIFIYLSLTHFPFRAGPDSRSYAVGSVAPWHKTSLSVSPETATARKGGLATGFYSGYAAGKAAGDGLDGVISGATAAYYKYYH